MERVELYWDFRLNLKSFEGFMNLQKDSCIELQSLIFSRTQQISLGIFNPKSGNNMPVVFECEPMQIIHGLFSTKVKNKKTGRSRKLKNWEIDAWMAFNNALEKEGIPVCYKVSSQDQLPQAVCDAYEEFCEAFVPEATEARYYSFYQSMTGEEYNVHKYAQDVISTVRSSSSSNL